MTNMDLLGPMLAALAATFMVLLVAVVVSFWKRETGRRIATWLAPGIGFWAGGYLVRGWPPIPPVEAAGWIFWVVGLVALVGSFFPKSPDWGRLVGAVGVIGGLLFLILQPLIGREWEGMAIWGWLGGLGLFWLGVWLVIATGKEAPRGWVPLLWLLISTVGLSVLLMVGGTASYAQYGLALAGVIAGAGLGSFFMGRGFLPDPRPAPILVAIPWGGFLIAAHFYSELPMSAALLAAAALLSLVVPWLPKVKSMRVVWIGAIQIAWTVLTLGIAIVLTHQAMGSGYDF